MKGEIDMTREERVANLAAIKASVEEMAREYNELMGEEKLTDANKKLAEIQEKVREYSADAKTLFFSDCKATEDPMLEAVKKLTYATICAKNEKRDDDTEVLVIEDRMKVVDLIALDKFCGTIGADKAWKHTMNKVNFLLTVQKCIDLGVDPKAVNDSYEISDIARAIKLGKTPTSKTNMLKTLNVVIAQMIGDVHKATSHDVNFLLSVYAKKSNRKALTVSCANHKNFCKLIAEICHRIVTGASYGVEYKEKKAG